MTITELFNERLAETFPDQKHEHLSQELIRCFKRLECFHQTELSEIDPDCLRNYLKNHPASNPLRDEFSLQTVEWMLRREHNQGIYSKDRNEKPQRLPVCYEHIPIDHLDSNATAAEVYELSYQLYIRFRSESAIRVYNHGRMLMEPISQRPFRLIRPTDVSRLCAGQKKYTFDLLLNTFKTMERYAYAYDIIHEYHFKGLNPVQNREKREFAHISSEDLDCLKKHIGMFTVDVALVLLYSGLTLEELTTFEQGWIDLEKEEIRIQCHKSRKSNRTVPIHPTILPVMKHWKQLTEDCFFRTVRGQRFIGRDFSKMTEMASIAYLGKLITPGDCRNHFQCQLAQTDATATQAALLLGNFPLGSGARYYIHPTAETLHRIVNSIC